jgi:eukaryotic-like serine/threonine-protein kinase
LSIAATNAGMILGTAAYMSPEQAKGRPADRPSDIFALGAVLYEMLTGRPAFEGEDTPDILGAVLKSEPDWTRLPRDVPEGIVRLLHLCLQKEVRKRRQTATDVRIDIEQALSQPSEIIAPAAPRTRERFWISVAVLLLVAVAVLVIPAHRYFREAPPAAPEMRTEINTPPSDVPLEFALSPDGTRLAFVANDKDVQRLWIRPLNAVTEQPLLGTDGADFPFWSPDSRSIGFFAGGKLKRIEIDGGPPQTLADAPGGRGGAWNREGVILFAPAAAVAMSRIAATGGGPEVATHLEQGQSSHRFPQFLPDGRHFLIYVLGAADRSGIYLVSVDSSDVKRLVAADAAGAWAPPGWLLYLQQGTLRAQALDIARGTLSGNPVTVANPVGFDSGVNNGGFSVSVMGMVAYRNATESRTQLVWFDRTGKADGSVGDPDENGLGYPELSPDSRRVAVDRTVQGNQDIWLIDLLRGGATRFTFDAALDRRPLWSPDGTQIIFQTNRKGASNLYTKPSGGAGAEQLLLESPNQKVPNSWSADGHFLLYGEDNPKTARDLWALPMRGDRKPIPVVNSPFYEGNGEFSPDGRWVAYHSNESGRFEIYVVPFPAGGGKWQISTGGISPRWRRDGKELFFIAPDGQMMAPTVSAAGTSFEAAPRVALFQTRIVGGGSAS